MSLVENLGKIAKSMGIQFTLNNRPINYAQVFADNGLMPALAKRADQLCSLCLGYGIGVTFEDSDKAKLGKQVKFDEFTPEVIRLLCLTDVINELAKSAPNKGATPLDELMYD